MRNLQFKFLIVIIILTITNYAIGMENETKTKAINLENMDKSVSPGDDFFKYVNGGWMKSNVIPEDKTRWGAFDELGELNRDQLLTIFKELENEAKPAGSVKQKISDFYNSGMNLEKINDLGAKPLIPYISKIEAIKNKSQLQKSINEFSKMGTYPVFAMFVSADQENSNMNIVHIYQSGLGLPDRDYYTEDNERFKEIRSEYVKHIAKMFTLIGMNDEKAMTQAENVMKLETSLAEASLTRLERRDPYKTFNKMTVAELQKVTPSFDWNEYFATMGAENVGTLNVAMPDFIANFEKAIEQYDIETWKSYLKWRLLGATSSYLSDDFVDARFEFFGKFLSGQEVIQDRWKRVLGVVNGNLGEAVGQIYVEKFFPPKAKSRMDELVKNLRIALRERIEGLEWMSDVTKTKAVAKLETMNVKIGYPDKWKDYSKLKIVPDSYLENALQSHFFALEEEMQKINKAVDKDEWHMSPQTVNAYYSPTMNEIVFPAGILQPPFFNMDADDAVNYGAIGVVIGHEMTHGFDDQGKQYDQEGNLKNWWTTEDAENFDKQVQVLVEQYDNFEMIDGMHVDGKLTLGENIADLGGLTVALVALRNATNGNLESPKIDGFTPLQRFFLSYGQIWRQNIRDKELIKRLKEDVHSPAEARVNAGVVNVPEWYEAFGVKPTSKLYVEPKERAIIW